MAIFGNRPDSPESETASTPRPRTTSAPPVGQVNMIGQGAVIEGTVQVKGDIRVGGRVQGEMEVEGKLITTDEGIIEGDIVAITADIAGEVKGSIVVKERLILRSTSNVQGDVRTPKMIIEDGAMFTGKADMTTSSSSAGLRSASAPKPVSKPSEPENAPVRTGDVSSRPTTV